jgi:glycosyltransferase involved in cell wall biosynthesis
MRISMVTGEYPPMEGGVGDFTHKLAVALCNQSHEVHILTTQQNHKSGIEKDQEGPLVYRRIQATGWPLVHTIKRWVHEISPDALNLQYQAAAYQMRGGLNIYPRFHRDKMLPLVVTFHDLLPPYLFPKAGPLRPWSVRMLAQHADGVIATNAEDQHQLRKELKVPKSKIRVIPIGSNIDASPPADFTTDQWRTAHDIAPGELLLGFFGFMNQNKGIDTLITALASLIEASMPVKLVFIGGRTGSSDPTNTGYAEKIDAHITQLGLSDHIRATGFTSPDEVSAALLSLDLCVLPYKDGASLRHGTLHAALKHGVPIVTTRPRVSIPQLVHGENCYLVPPDDPKALENAIRTLAERPERHPDLGRGAKTLAQSFSWDRIAGQTTRFFRALQENSLSGRINRHNLNSRS